MTRNLIGDTLCDLEAHASQAEAQMPLYAKTPDGTRYIIRSTSIVDEGMDAARRTLLVLNMEEPC